MSLLLKNRDTLSKLFATFSRQEVLLLNQHLTATWPLLAMLPAQLLAAMKSPQVNFEIFLGKKCLPLILFYLADNKKQKETFLSMPLLAKLFESLPAVEAIIFKDQIHQAQLVLQETNQLLFSLLSTEPLVKQVESRESVVQLNHYQIKSKQSLSVLAEAEKEYLNCFYYLQAGELFIVESVQGVNCAMLLYSELSPLQQLKAQQMFSNSDDQLAHQSASA